MEEGEQRALLHSIPLLTPLLISYEQGGYHPVIVGEVSLSLILSEEASTFDKHVQASVQR